MPSGMPSSAPTLLFAASRLSDSFAASIACSAVTSTKAFSVSFPASMADRQASVSSVALISFERSLSRASEIVRVFNVMGLFDDLRDKEIIVLRFRRVLHDVGGLAAVRHDIGRAYAAWRRQPR